jgi:K+-sensing histidine kinase KdpD
VRSQDDVRRLATNVSRMRDSTAGYVRQIEDARARLDHALEQVSDVSRALTTATPGGGGAPPDVDVLAVLANNAAIAMENGRLFEQERETVRRLLELDSLKTDFLATVQHELRNPLTAILGLADLLEMCWDTWEEGTKLEAVRDIQVAATNLHDIVETVAARETRAVPEEGEAPPRRKRSAPPVVPVQ